LQAGLELEKDRSTSCPAPARPIACSPRELSARSSARLSICPPGCPSIATRTPTG
jgi:hypothetical protein